MKPITITDATRRVTKPSEWVEELDGPILDLDIYDYVDDLTGIKFMRTGWVLEEQDFANMIGGGVLWLDIAGVTFPVIRLGTSEPPKEELCS